MQFPQAYDPLRSFQVSWKQLWRTPLTIFLGVLLPVVVQFAVQLPLQLLMMSSSLAVARHGERPQMPEFLPGFMLVMVPLGIGLFLFAAWIDIGFTRAAERAL